MVSENLPLDNLIPDKPSGTLPLLVRMPDGQHTQVNVPTSATVDDVATEIAREAREHPTASEYFKLSFSNSDLDPTTSLLDTGIVDAYHHAGSLLQLISNSSSNPGTRAAAVESACAVVERISNGVTNMQALCDAAMNGNVPNDLEPLQKNQSQKNIDTQDNDPNQFQSDIPQEGPPTPSQLARSLSKRLPNLFAPSSNQELNNISLDHNQSNNKQPTLGRQQNQLVLQPSISAIRDARRRARSITTPSGVQSTNSNRAPESSSNAANAYTMGGSTHTMTLPAEFTGIPDSPKTQALLTTNSGKSTWFEDIMTTWEVGAVRESGVLNGSKQGQEISDYFNELEAQTEREIEMEKIAQQDEGETLRPGDSSDEEEEEKEEQVKQPQNTQPNNNRSVNNVAPASSRQVASKVQAEKPSMNGATIANPQMDNTEMKTEKTGLGQAVSRTLQRPSLVPQKQSIPAQSNSGNRMHNASRQHVLVGMNNQAPMTTAQLTQVQMNTQNQTFMHRRQIQAQLRIPPATTPYNFISPPASTTPLSISTVSPTSSTGVPSSGREWALMSDPNMNCLRQHPAKIAPTPGGEPSSTASAALANGTLNNSMFPSVAGVPPSSWQNQAPTPGPKKRGRKRKYPQLTDEERALVRKEQNRESAKLSRVRRKAIAAEYEERLSSVINENANLRKQVAGLNDRLAYLQSLLTVSVRCEPPSLNQVSHPGQHNVGQIRKQC